MALINKPTDISKVWAATGDKREPDDAKKSLGWVEEIPTYQDFNWLFGKIDQMGAHCNQLGVPIWDSETEYQANKSYAQGSNGYIYHAKTTHTNSDPVADTSETNWVCVLVKPTKGAKPDVALTPSGGWSAVTQFSANVSNGVLTVTGHLVGGSAASTVATLPVGYRPASTHNLYAIQTNGGGTTWNPVGIIVNTDGTIVAAGASHGGELRLMLTVRM